jgi:hypothetical protein
LRQLRQQSQQRAAALAREIAPAQPGVVELDRESGMHANAYLMETHAACKVGFDHHDMQMNA